MEELNKAIESFNNHRDIESAIIIIENTLLGNVMIIGNRYNIVRRALHCVVYELKHRLNKEE